MNDKVPEGNGGPWRILTEASVQQIDRKLTEAVDMRFAEVVLVVENGKYRFIRGPSPSEPVSR
jgi:hypothetical protein